MEDNNHTNPENTMMTLNELHARLTTMIEDNKARGIDSLIA